MNKIKKELYNIARNYVKKYLTGNLGKVVEDDDKLTCYVNKRKLKKKDYSYVIACHGISENNKQLANEYNLNKPICYVIDGLEFKKDMVCIFGYNDCEVFIKKCHFCYQLYARINGKCNLENTDIESLRLLQISADELVIKNMNMNNHFSLSSDLNISLGATEKLDIIDSNIGKVNEKTRVSIISGGTITSNGKLNLVNSKISGDKVECITNKMVSDNNSKIIAKDKIDLSIDDFEKINIISPTIIFNGKALLNKNNNVLLEKIIDPLKKQRLSLMKTLKEIKNQCEITNIKKFTDYKNDLESKTISKILKK